MSSRYPLAVTAPAVEKWLQEYLDKEVVSNYMRKVVGRAVWAFAEHVCKSIDAERRLEEQHKAAQDNVTVFPGVTRWDLPPERIIDNIPRDMQTILVLGWDKNGDLYAAANKADGGDVLWLMEKAKLTLLTIDPEAKS